MPKRWLAVIYSAILLIIGLVLGILLQKFYPVGNLVQSIRGGPPTPSQQTDALGFAIYPAPTPHPGSAISVTLPTESMVILALGQSNAGNWGETPYTPSSSVYNFFQGQLYQAKDPLFGADGMGGSLWTRLADQMIDAHRYSAVVIAPLSIGSSSISRWTFGGDIYPKVLQTLQDLRAHDLRVTHVLWLQGEGDAWQKTRGRDYKTMFLQIVQTLRDENIAAPIFVATATRCVNEPDLEIREAQQALATLHDQGLYAGPDLDVLGTEFRVENCHFSERGQQQAAHLWFDAIMHGN